VLWAALMSGVESSQAVERPVTKKGMSFFILLILAYLSFALLIFIYAEALPAFHDHPCDPTPINWTE
jgi:hypothetical protein